MLSNCPKLKRAASPELHQFCGKPVSDEIGYKGLALLANLEGTITMKVQSQLPSTLWGHPGSLL